MSSRNTRASGIALLTGVALLLLTAPGLGAESGGEASGGIKVLPGYQGDAYLKYYLNHPNDLSKERYVTEGSLSLDFALLSSDDRLFLFWNILMTAGMGPSVAENLPFSPLEMHYELVPFVERRTEQTLWRIGWLHACDHLILKAMEHPWYEEEGQGVAPDVYYNRAFAGVGTPTVRMPLQRQAFLHPGSGVPRPPFGLTWYVELGYYVRSLGGWVDSSSLSAHNDWNWDVKGEIRYPLWLDSAFALFANSRTHLLFDTDGEAFWREKLELEVLFEGGSCGSSIFFGAYVLDEHPRDSKEDLMDLGVRLFF
jgi:hypothetical protein